MQQIEDKRRYKRFSVEGIHGNMLFVSEINIVNISMGGVAIETNRRLHIGSEYTLKLEDLGKGIAIKGTVVWAVLREGRKSLHGEVIPIYRVGIEFKNVLSDKTAELVDFIDAHKKADNSRLRGLRFKIHSPEKAVLNYVYSYTVKKISLGGMLIESSEAFKIGEIHPMEIFLLHDTSIRFSGRIASCLEVEGKPSKHYDIGIEFMEMSEQDKTALTEFIDSMDTGGL